MPALDESGERMQNRTASSRWVLFFYNNWSIFLSNDLFGLANHRGYNRVGSEWNRDLQL